MWNRVFALAGAGALVWARMILNEAAARANAAKRATSALRRVSPETPECVPANMG
mgnify:CR=1 FL=1